MIQELSDKVWSNAGFHEASRRIELAWLRKDLGVADAAGISTDDAVKLMQAAAILACSSEQQQPTRW